MTPPSLSTSRLGALSCLALSLLLVLSSCDDGSKKRQKDLDDLNAFVKNQKDSVDKYADKSWTDIENTYNAKKADLERDTAKMNQDMRNSYYKTVNDWQAYREEFSKRADENKGIAAMDAIRKSLALDGVRTDFTDVTAANIAAAYEHFVSTVNTNKEAYTKEQWTVVNVSWKALKGRKRELGKDIKSADMSTIDKKELQYAGIKVANRPSAETEEEKREGKK